MTLTPGGTFQLASGRTLRLLQFSQRDIYVNVVEGVPCALVNDRAIETARHEGERMSGHVALLLEPTPTPLPNPRQETGEFAPARIPSIVCHAHFRSAPTPRAQASDDVSELAVIWFQEHYGWPSDDVMLQALRTIDWDRWAEDQGFF